MRSGSLDDGAEVHAGHAGGAFAADVDEPLGVAEQFSISIIGLQGVAAILDEAEHVVEIALGDHGVGGGGLDLGEHGVGIERGGGGGQKQVLCQDIEPAGSWKIPVLLAGGDALDGGLAFEQLEAVGGDEEGVGGLVHAVIGAADALEQARDALGGADLDDLVDAAPVDAEVERGGGDDGAELAGGHSGFDFAALADVEAAVVDGDGEGLVVQLP